jgi:5'-3' exonuclease
MYRNKDSHRDKNKVVYGLDADLIILTMLKGYPNTYLFRESTYYPFEVDKNVEYLFMDINEFRNAIMVDFGISDYVNSKSAFDDYIFLTFLLGNDFIPNLFILKIQKGGFEIMRDIYKDGLRRFRRFLVNETGIDLEFLSFIIYGLYKNENKILGDLNDEHSRWRPYLNPKLDEYDRKKALLNFYPYYVRERDYIQLGKNGWQARYNNYWLGCNDKDIVDNMVTNYLESLEWILAYYRGGCKNWFWHYKYAVAPSLYSLYQGIESLRKNSKCLSGLVEYRDVDNPDAFNLYQLLVVIPKKSIRVIPKKYRDITLKQEFTYLFPHDFKLLTLFKRYYHDCFAVLPRLENNLYSRVEHHINNITI